MTIYLPKHYRIYWSKLHFIFSAKHLLPLSCLCLEVRWRISWRDSRSLECSDIFWLAHKSWRAVWDSVAPHEPLHGNIMSCFDTQRAHPSVLNNYRPVALASCIINVVSCWPTCLSISTYQDQLQLLWSWRSHLHLLQQT